MSLMSDTVTPQDNPNTPQGTTQGATDQPGGNRDWIPEAYRNEKVFESVKDQDTLFKNYIEAQKFIGGSVRVPKDDASPEEWGKFYERLGRPAKPEDYKLEGGQLPDGMQIDPKLQEDFAKFAHENGLTTKQAQSLHKWYFGKISDGYQTNAAKVAEASTALRQEWGVAFAKNLALAQRAARQFGGDETMKMFDDTGLGNDPRVIRLFARIGQQLSEDKVLTERDTGAVISSQSAKQKIAAIMSNPKHAYFVADDPNHAAAVKEVADLHALAYNPV